MGGKGACTKRTRRSYFKSSENSETICGVLNHEKNEVNILTGQKISIELEKDLDDPCEKPCEHFTTPRISRRGLS